MMLHTFIYFSATICYNWTFLQFDILLFFRTNNHNKYMDKNNPILHSLSIMIIVLWSFLQTTLVWKLIWGYLFYSFTNKIKNNRSFYRPFKKWKVQQSIVLFIFFHTKKVWADGIHINCINQGLNFRNCC